MLGDGDLDHDLIIQAKDWCIGASQSDGLNGTRSPAQLPVYSAPAIADTEVVDARALYRHGKEYSKGRYVGFYS
jgi:hypothetical protein